MATNLAAFLERPEAHRQLLRNYRGAYSLGITRSPSGDDALLLRIEGDPPQDIPKTVQVDDRQVAVIIQGGFRKPSPL